MRRSTPLAALACGLLVAGCAGSPKATGRATTTAPSTTRPTSTASPPTTTSGSSRAPTVEPATYTDTPVGHPGYALVVNPGPAGSDTLGGVAVFEYQDGKEAGYFSFSGRAASAAPFTLSIKGDRAATTATARVTSASTITIEDCARLFSPAVANASEGEAEPPAPASCTFGYKLSPGLRRPAQPAPTNLTATAAMNSGLLDAYLAEHGWQALYGSDITLRPGSTYLAYDPQTGLDWAYAGFTYRGPDTATSNSPDVAMQDGGDDGIFYQIPGPGGLPSPGDYWVMVEIGGEPPCYSDYIVPRSVIGLWGLVDPPECTPG